MIQFFDLEEGRLFLWLPVFLAVGITGYFSLSFEPTLFYVVAMILFVMLIVVLMRHYLRWLVIPAIFLAVASGFMLAKFRTEIVRAPVLSKVKGFYLVEGRLESMTKLSGNARQLHLKNLKLSKVSPDKTQFRIRITTRIKGQDLLIGSRVKLRAILRPPPGPVRPAGFDFARQAWFSRLGAVGFAVSKVEVVKKAPSSYLRFDSEAVRQIVSDKIRAVIKGHGEDIAVALIVGEKRSIDKEVLSAIRAAGLAHMLAISGMHMALVAGTTYWVLRAFLALFEMLALRFDVRKIAAIGAILIAGGYYLLSGMGISTLRAFIMITIMFVAILLGRKALSLRNVAVAALLILVFLPESLLSVGFQMSFASVVALVSFYESGLFHRSKVTSELAIIRLSDKLVRGVYGIFMTTLIAGLAVAPIAVYHFHHITTYSVVGNVLAMPVLSVVVMPMALIGLIVMPFDFHAIPLFLMGQGNSLIVSIAQYVASFDDARVNVGTIDLKALLALLSGGLWLSLCKSCYRYIGMPVIVLGLAMAPFRPTPFLLIERDGKNVVLIDDNKNMWPMAPRVGRYSLKKWQSAYGTSVSHSGKVIVKDTPRTADKKISKVSSKVTLSAQKRTGWRCDEVGCTILFKGMTIAYSSHPGALVEDCNHADILVANYPIPRSFKDCRKVKKIIDIKSLKRKGAHAIYLEKGELKTIDSRKIRGERPWTRHN